LEGWSFTTKLYPRAKAIVCDCHERGVGVNQAKPIGFPNVRHVELSALLTWALGEPNPAPEDIFGSRLASVPGVWR
jgi:hypothetical protein